MIEKDLYTDNSRLNEPMLYSSHVDIRFESGDERLTTTIQKTCDICKKDLIN